MRKIYLFFLLLFLFSACHEKKYPYKLENKIIIGYIEDFNSSNWETVYKAKDSLEKLDSASLPYLLENLNSKDKYVKLKNTADLIYPGATEFYGSGWVIDYDLDWLSIRTGWAIEDITFENFGFKELKISEKELIEMQKNNIKYEEYLKTGKYNFDIKPDRIKAVKKCIEKANEWWEENYKNWTRLNGITAALKSNDIQRQSSALQYLRFGEYCIAGLSRNYFDKELRPIIENLLNSKEESIKQDSELLLSTVDYKGDMEFYNITTKCW